MCEHGKLCLALEELSSCLNPAIPLRLRAVSASSLRSSTATADTKELFEGVLEPAGADVNANLVVQFLVVFAAGIMGALTVRWSWRRGTAPLGFGMGGAIVVLLLFAGARLFRTSLAWAVAEQALTGVTGVFALIRQIGGVPVKAVLSDA